MLQVYRYDENYLFVEPVLVTEMDDTGNYAIPADCTTVALPDSPSLFKPKFDAEKQEWTETATQEEIEAILNSGGKEISVVDLLKQQNAALSLQIAKSEKENEERRMREAEQALAIAQMQKQIEDLKGAN
ncbi:hypothetical protein V6D44_14515 [Bacillus sp. 0209A]|uniref:hypothetical protein n=1 Tax=Bacillus sp. 0209A TaxID=3120562 RepID=UPI002FDB0CF3